MTKLQDRRHRSRLAGNAVGLMAASGATAILGFLFWVIAARAFSPTAIGLATTLLSMSTLVSVLGLAGFDTIVIRVLGQSQNRSAIMTTSLVVSGFISALLAVGFCILTPALAPRLAFVARSPSVAVLFIAVTVLSTWNTLTNAIFIAYQRASYVVLTNVVFGASKLVMPVISQTGGPTRILLYIGMAQLINVLLSLFLMMAQLGYRPRLAIDYQFVRQTVRFGSAVYLANILNLLPDFSLPIIVLDRLGPRSAAFFYVAFTLSNTLYTVAFATTQALLAEASNNQDRLAGAVQRSLKMMVLIMVPSVIVLAGGGSFILRIFGSAYSAGAATLLSLMAFSGLLVIQYSLAIAIFKLTGALLSILATTGTNAICITLAVLVFTSTGHASLTAVGVAWLLGTAASVLAAILCLGRSRRALVGLPLAAGVRSVAVLVPPS